MTARRLDRGAPHAAGAALGAQQRRRVGSFAAVLDPAASTYHGVMSALDQLDPADRAALCAAKAQLEHPTLAARLANLAGAPFERSARLLPQKAREVVAQVTHTAILRALRVALASSTWRLGARLPRSFTRWASAATGAAGGFFGLPALALEIPISTVVILRGITDIARASGEDLEDPAAQLACVQVFALGGFARNDDASETGYYATRAGLATAVREAAEYVARHGVGEGAPVLVRLASAIAARFGLVVSDKLVLAALPVVGAAGGATLNALFADHFERVARGHFTVRRLERRYGAAVVREAYQAVAAVS